MMNCQAQDKTINNEFNKLKKVGYKILFLVNLELPRNQFSKKMYIDGYTIEWLSYEQFVKTKAHFKEYEKNSKDLIKRMYNKAVFIDKYTIFSIYVTGYDQKFCIDRACEIYDKFLGLLNLAKYMGITSQQFGLGQSCTYSNLTGMNIIFILKRNKLLPEWGLLQHSSCDVISFDDTVFTRLDELHKIFLTYDKRYDIHDNLYSFLLLYQKAMKAPDPEIRFLIFWEIMEMFLRKDQKENYSDIIDRTKSIFMDNWSIKEYLELLKRKRNGLVHGVNTEIDEYDIHIMKSISEGVFKFFINYDRKIINKPNIYEFLDLMNEDKNRLLMKRKMIDTIIKLPRSE